MTWRPVAGFERLYEVSDDGQVRRIAAARGAVVGRVLKQKACRKGYRRVTLTVDYSQHYFAVHRLVAEAFIGPCPPGHECNHLDGDKGNNSVSNLEWVTPQENAAHAVRTGLRVSLRGEQHPRAKLTAVQVEEIRALRGRERQIDTARRYGISDVRVSQLQRGPGWGDFDVLHERLARGRNRVEPLYRPPEAA